MAVDRHDPPAQHVRAGFERFGIVDLDGLIVETEGCERKLRAVRPHERQNQRRDRFAEAEREFGGTLRQHRAVRRIGRDQRRMSKRATGHGQCRHRHEHCH